MTSANRLQKLKISCKTSFRTLDFLPVLHRFLALWLVPYELKFFQTYSVSRCSLVLRIMFEYCLGLVFVCICLHLFVLRALLVLCKASRKFSRKASRKALRKYGFAGSYAEGSAECLAGGFSEVVFWCRAVPPICKLIIIRTS